MRRLTALVCIAAAAPSLARADEAADKARGKAVWREGVKDYDLGDFDAAIKKFEAAYQIFPNPDILFNLGQAHRKTKTYERAIHYFRTFLRYKPNAPNRDVVEQLIAELDGLIAAQKASNERPPDTVHTPPPPPAAPSPAAPAPAPAQPAETPRWYQDTLGLTLAGAGLVALGVGTGFLIHSSGLSSDADGTRDEQTAQDLHDSAKTFQLAGGITVVAGAALLTGGIVKMVLHSRSDSGVQVSLGVSGIGISGKF